MIDLKQFPQISLEEMDGVRLMNRVDTKFVTDEMTICKLLESAYQAGYSILSIDGFNQLSYKTVYYDTDNYDMYLEHHNRHLVRQKIRVRSYMSSGITFLEVKNKNNHGRTKKKRIQLKDDSKSWIVQDRTATDWLNCKSKYPIDELSESLQVRFSRITLVNKTRTERVTIDREITFTNLRNNVAESLKKAVIIELKQDSRSESDMKQILLQCRIKRYKISKYCIGIALTEPLVKKNRFIEKINYLNKPLFA